LRAHLLLWTVLLPVPLAAQSLLLEPGTLVDRAAERVYTMAPEGAVVALRLSNGEPLWQSDSAQKPLGLIGDRLLAYDERSRRVLFMSPTDGRSDEWPPVPLSIPQTAWHQIDDGLGRTLTFSFRGDGQGADLFWQTVTEVVPAIPPGQDPPAPRIASGGLRIDGRTGAVEATAERFPEPAKRLRLLSQQNRIAGIADRQLTSVDEDHILVSKRIGDDRQREKYRWTLYDRTGKQIGSTPSDRSADVFVVADQRLVTLARPAIRRAGNRYQEDPLRLRIVDLTTATILWERPIRDTAHHGPYPP